MSKGRNNAIHTTQCRASLGWLTTGVVFLACLTASAQEHRRLVMQHVAMNTELEVVVYIGLDDEPEAVREACREAFAEIDALEARISRWRPDSFTSLVNREAAERPVAVAADLMDILLAARRYYERTDGVFDVTVGPLLERWGFYAKGGALPTREELEDIRSRVGFNHVKLDTAARTVYFEKPGMRLDFGGIGKGLALDRAAALLRERGITAARLDMGTSTLVALGAPPGRAGWTVDIRSPYNTAGDANIAGVDIRDESLSTSSRTERYVEIDGRRYGHIIDPRTGMPAEKVLSATAIAPTGLETDALSTAFYILGVEATRNYCASYPEVRAILVVEKDDAQETIFINFNKHCKEQS